LPWRIAAREAWPATDGNASAHDRSHGKDTGLLTDLVGSGPASRLPGLTHEAAGDAPAESS
jgi:hypothetical protein